MTAPTKSFGRRKKAEAPKAASPNDTLIKFRRVFLSLEREDQLAFLRMINVELLEAALDGRSLTIGDVKKIAPAAGAAKPKRIDGAERRRAERSAAQRKATIYFNGNMSTLDVVIVNISATGCRLQVSQPSDVPEMFPLIEKGASRARLCRQVWRKFHEVGVEFVD